MEIVFGIIGILFVLMVLKGIGMVIRYLFVPLVGVVCFLFGVVFFIMLFVVCIIVGIGYI